jgi:hypothetical protein
LFVQSMSRNAQALLSERCHDAKQNRWRASATVMPEAYAVPGGAARPHRARVQIDHRSNSLPAALIMPV